MSRWRAVIPAALFVLVYLAPLGLRPLTCPDETRYAEIPREMLTSGDWIVPRLNGLRYFEKPPLGYWLNAASIRLLGQNALAVRLPSVLAAAGAAAGVAWLVVQLTRSVALGLLAAGMYLSFGFVLVISVVALPDNILNAGLTVGLVFFYRACHLEARGARRRAQTACGVCLGLAFLAKGFVALVVPLVTIAPFLLWEGRLREGPRLLLLPLLVALATALPWAVAVAVHEPAFWPYFIWTEHLARFLDPQAGQHPKPMWYFVPVILAGALPWTVMAPAVLRGLRASTVVRSGLRFGICWLVLPFLFFSLSSGKLRTYILPCFAPLAVLGPLGLAGFLSLPGRNALRRGAGVWAACLAVLALGLLLLFGGVPGGERWEVFGPGETWKQALWVLGTVIWLLGALVAAWGRPSLSRMAAFAAAPALFYLALQTALPARVLTGRAPGAFLAAHAAEVTPETLLVADPEVIRAVCWYFRRQDVRVLEPGGELDYGLAWPDASGRLVRLADLPRLVAAAAGAGTRTVLIFSAEYYNRRQPFLPQPDARFEGDGFLLLVFHAGELAS